MVTHPVLYLLLVYSVCVFRLSFRLLRAMPVDQPRTVVIHAHGMVVAKSSNVVAQMLSKKLDFSKVRHIQFIPGGRIRVTFASVEYRNDIRNRKTVQIDDVHFLKVTASDSPVTNVYVHYLPVEAGDVGLRLALLPILNVSRALRTSPLVPALCVCRWTTTYPSTVTSRATLVVCGMQVSR